MVSIKETFSKIYADKNVHIWLFVLVLVGAILSNLFDIVIGKPNSSKQNIVDGIISVLLSACSLQFLHNVLHNKNNGEIPLFDKIQASFYYKLLTVSLILGCLLLVVAFPIVIILMPGYLNTAGWIIAVIIVGALTLLSSFYAYVNITLADTMSIAKSVNPMIIFRAFARNAGKTYAQFFKYIGLTILFFIAFVIMYVIFSLLGLDSILKISKDCSVLDILMHAIAWYALFVLWYIMYPYSLLESYIEKLRGEDINENA